MKIRNLCFALICLSFLLHVSCAVKKINPLEYSKTKILFGAGGGFSGAEHSFMLLDNGQLFSMGKIGEEPTRLGKIDLNKAKQVFQTYNLFNFGNIDLNDPGNTYKFLEYSANGSSHKITWGNSDVDEKLDIVHAILMKHMKSTVEY